MDNILKQNKPMKDETLNQVKKLFGPLVAKGSPKKMNSENRKKLVDLASMLNN